MQTFLGFPPRPLTRPALLTIGNFDGVHRGHQALICQMAQAAHDMGCLAGLLTFDPHPLVVLRPSIPLSHLTSPEERVELLSALGLDFTLILPFDRNVAALPAAEFMRRLTAAVPLRGLWIGPDFALGRGREGDASRLATLGRELGYEVRVFPPFDWQGEPVRSSRIRGLLAEDGDARQAAELLGRPYQVWGAVTSGQRRGRTLGFPTANVALPPGRLTPAFGVYACWAWQGDRGYPAAVNVGVRPTFDDPQKSQPTCEAYLLDFTGDLYGETLGLSFIGRLRGEQKFADRDALVAQIRADAEAARDSLADPDDHATGDWVELRHTADWAIELAAPSQRGLFATAARAMFTLQDADRERPIVLARSVNLTDDDPAELLVTWLNRLLLGQELAWRVVYPLRDPRNLAQRAAGGRLWLSRDTQPHRDQGGHILRLAGRRDVRGLAGTRDV